MKNCEFGSIRSKCDNYAENTPFQVVQNDPSTKNHRSQTVWVRILKINTPIVHIPKNLNMKGNRVNFKTVSLRAYAVNVTISDLKC